MFKSLKKFVLEVLATLVVENIAVFLLSTIIALLSNRGFETFVSYEVSICYALIVFVAVYTVSTLCFLKPYKFRFRISSLDINVEYLGDEVIVRENFVVRTNRLSAAKLYTRREWFSNEEFTLVAVSDGFKVVPTEIRGQTHHFYIQFPEKSTFGKK